MNIRLGVLLSSLMLGAILLHTSPTRATLRGDEVVTEALASQQGPASMSLVVKFKVKEGWHVYGLNPGEMGRPPKIKVQLPDGYISEEAVWPEPHEFVVGEYRCSGYSDDFTVTIPVRKGTVSPNGAEGIITVSWLACDGVACVPGKVKLSAALT